MRFPLDAEVDRKEHQVIIGFRFIGPRVWNRGRKNGMLAA